MSWMYEMFTQVSQEVFKLRGKFVEQKAIVDKAEEEQQKVPEKAQHYVDLYNDLIGSF